MSLHSLIHLRLDRLATFVVVGRTGSFSTAARMLFITQPQVSRQIAELEQALGVSLFDRSTRPVALTAEGKKVWDSANDFLGRLSSLSDDPENGASIRLTLGVPEGLTDLYIRARKELASQHPEIDLVLSEAPNRELRGYLASAQIDMAVLVNPRELGARPAQQRVLWTDRIVALLPQLDSRRRTSPLRFSDFEQEAVISLGLDETVLIGDGWRSVMQASSESSLAALVSAGVGIGLCTHTTALRARTPGLRVVPVDGSVDVSVVVEWMGDDGRRGRSSTIVADVLAALSAGESAHGATVTEITALDVTPWGPISSAR